MKFGCNQNEGFKFADSTGNMILQLNGANSSSGNGQLSATFVGVISASGGNSSNWNTSYGWGDHASGGYLSDDTNYLKSNTSDSFSGILTGTAAGENLKVGGIRGTDKGSQTGEYIHLYNRVHIGGPNGWGASSHGAPNHGLSTWGSANFGMNSTGVLQLNGTTFLTKDRLLQNVTNTNWDTAYGWGNHASGGYLTSSSTQTKYLRTDVSDVIESGSVVSFKTSAGNERGYIQATDTNDSHFIIATSGGEDIAFKDGGVSGGVNMVIRGDGNVIVTGTESDFANNSGNWNTSYGWGNHASVEKNFLAGSTSNTGSSGMQNWNSQESTLDLNPTTDWYTSLRIGHGDPVGYYSNTLAIQMTGGDYGRIYTRTVSNGTKQSWYKYWHGGDFTTTNISNWNTAYGWGDHSQEGYLTSADGGKAADSELLDGIDSTQFLRSDASDTHTATLTVNGQFIFNSSLNSSYREGIRLNVSTTGWGAAVIGGVRDSISGITDAWWVARNPSKDFVISYGTSANSGGLYLPHNSSALQYKNNRIWNESDFANNSGNWNTAYGWGDHSGLYGLKSLSENKTYTSGGNAVGSYLGGHYSGGGTEKPNSATFGSGKLKIAMLSNGNLGFGGSWNDVLWISAYNGGDVKGSHALVFDKYSTNVYVSDQSYDSASWGTGYQLWHTGHFQQSSINNWNTAYGWGDHSTQGYTGDQDLSGYLPIGGKAADSELLDGIDSSQFLRSDTTDTMSGVLTINHTNDNQLLLTSPSSWTGIGFNDSASAATDYIWHNGTHQTFAIGGGGSNISGKKLHIHGGATIGSGYAATAVDSNGLYVQGNVRSAGTGRFASYVATDTSQSRSKIRLWDVDTNYAIGFKNGYDFGHIGNSSGTGDEYAVSFLTNDNNARGFWWGKDTHSDNQGAMAVTADGRLNVAKSVSIGEGESVVNPSSTPLYVKGTVAGSTVFDVQGTQGQLFSITDDLTGDIFSVSDISGIPILTVNSLGVVTIDDTLRVTGDVIAYSSSDSRLKDNVTPISNPLDKLKMIGGYEFDWNGLSKNNGHDVGVIAQEIESVLPELVETRGDGFKGVQYDKLTALLIEAVKEQQIQIDELKSKLNK